MAHVVCRGDNTKTTRTATQKAARQAEPHAMAQRKEKKIMRAFQVWLTIAISGYFVPVRVVDAPLPPRFDEKDHVVVCRPQHDEQIVVPRGSCATYVMPSKMG